MSTCQFHNYYLKVVKSCCRVFEGITKTVTVESFEGVRESTESLWESTEGIMETSMGDMTMLDVSVLYLSVLDKVGPNQQEEKQRDEEGEK